MHFETGTAFASLNNDILIYANLYEGVTVSALLLWIDTHEAKIFQLLPEGIQTEKIHLKGPHHHTETQGKNHTVAQSDESHLYHSVCERIEKLKSTECVVMGPGMGRVHFMSHLEKHHPQLKAKFKGSQKLDHMTDPQLIDEGMKFFKHLHRMEA